MMVLAYGFIKLSIIFFVRRIFNVTNGTWFNVFSTALVIIDIVWTLGFFLAFLCGCKTRTWANWSTLEDVTIYCGNGLAAEMALVCSDLIIDILTFILPLPMVSNYSLEVLTYVGANPMPL